VHPALARRWFRAAAAQGDVTSEFCMGFCWYDGGWITLIAYLLLYFLSTDLTFFAHFFLLYVRYL
jgi:TPR repeat protein